MNQIRNSSGKIIGLSEQSGDRLIVRSPSSKLLGWYDRRENRTRKANSQIVGTGDQTSSLLR